MMQGIKALWSNYWPLALVVVCITGLVGTSLFFASRPHEFFVKNHCVKWEFVDGCDWTDINKGICYAGCDEKKQNCTETLLDCIQWIETNCRTEHQDECLGYTR